MKEMLLKTEYGTEVKVRNLHNCINRGESEELAQLYKQLAGDRTRFWSATSTAGLELRKIHVGLPAMLCDMLASIVVDDMNLIDSGSRQEDWV